MGNEISTNRQRFAATVSALAERELVNLAGSEAGKQAAARVALAFRSAAATAKDPDAFYDCSPESVASCMATSAFTGIMPGGPFTGCYLIPKRVNGVQTLNWWINHRGIKTLARRANQAIETIPYFAGDTVTILRGREYGVDIQEGEADRDDAASLEGVVVMVRSLDTGLVLCVRKVTKSQISARRAKSDSVDTKTGEAKHGPWRDWPIEMAEKTAIKFAAGRGDVFFDDVGNVAMSREAEAHPVIEAKAEVVPTTKGKAALGLTEKPPAADMRAEADKLNGRETVPADDTDTGGEFG